mgnify:CR=1 FL=1
MAMNKYILAAAAILVVALGLVLGSARTDTTAIRLGVIISETGVAASFGEMSHKGIVLAVQEINAKGGIDGRKVEVVFEDDQTNPTVALSAYQKLVSVDNVSAIIGSNFDFVTQPLFAAAKTGTVAVVTPSSPYYAGYFEQNDNAFFMMTDLPSIVHTFDAYLKTQQYAKLGILRYPSVFGEVFSRELGAAVDETYAEIGNNDFRTQILKLKSAGVDLVFLDMVANDPEQFLKQSRELGYSPKIITHVGVKQALSSTADASMFNGIVVLDWNVSPSAFAQKFKDAYGVLPDNSANRAYDAVYVLAEAVAKTKSPREVSAYLATHSFETPNGTVRFGANHEAADMAVILERIENGVLVSLE